LSDEPALRPAPPGDEHPLIASYAATENPLFLWDLLKMLTSPQLDGAAVVLPTELREYLHEGAAALIVAATMSAEAFPAAAVAALGLRTGKNKKSVAKEWERIQNYGLLLDIYDEMKARRGASGATLFMSESVKKISVGAMNTRLTAARKFDEDLRRRSGRAGRSAASPRPMKDLPDILIANLLRNLTGKFWRGYKAPARE
jgi:hypothetical protein